MEDIIEFQKQQIEALQKELQRTKANLKNATEILNEVYNSMITSVDELELNTKFL